MNELFKGKESLVTAFWFLGIGYIVFAIGLVAIMALSQSIVVVVLSVIAIIAFFIFYQISIWNCSNNCSWVGWSNVARAIVISRSVFFSINIILQIGSFAELANFISTIGIMFELSIGTIALAVLVISKLTGSSLSKPETIDHSSTLTNDGYLKDAKVKYLAGDYEGALTLFRSANSIQELDDLSKSYEKMCLRRLNKHNKAIHATSAR